MNKFALAATHLQATRAFGDDSKDNKLDRNHLSSSFISVWVYLNVISPILDALGRSEERSASGAESATDDDESLPAGGQ